MSVSASYLERTGRSGSQGDKGLCTYTATYRVECSSSSDGPMRVLAQAVNASPNPIPHYRDIYKIGTDRDTRAYCKTRTAERYLEDKVTYYRVRCEWGPLEPGEQSQEEENPLARPTEYWIEHSSYSELVTKDKDDKLIVNACEQQFDEPLEQDVSYMVLCAEKNYTTLQEIIDLNLRYGMKVNKDVFHGASKRKVLCHPIACSRQIIEGKYSYYRATFRFEFRDDTWARRICNRGMKFYDNADDKNLETATDNSTPPIPLNEPILLARDGTRLDDGVEGNYLTFNVREEAAFKNIGV